MTDSGLSRDNLYRQIARFNLLLFLAKRAVVS